MLTAIAAGLASLQLTIRELRAEDIPRAASLLSDAFAPPGGYNLLQQRILQKETEAGLTARLGESLTLVAEQQDALVGSVEVFTPAFLEGKDTRFWNASLPLESYISALAVDPAYRQQGVATALMEEVEQRAWDAGEGFVSLQVDATNKAAASLYLLELGYEVVGKDNAVSSPSNNPLVANLLLGGARQRELLVLQKARPAAEATPAAVAAAAEDGFARIARWLRTRLKMS